ncbi:MAG: 4'-phosphopantetheinyl transferase superfamily protein [Prevotella sp.]|nr:4'-phosphopantetheinyl transferase superfamily protein [Prevotella sp.]
MFPMVYLNDDIAHFDLQAAMPLLSQQRREQCLRFKHDIGRNTCAAAYLLLIEGLRQEYGITEPPLLAYGEHGKPYIVGRPDIHFNISHCSQAAICVLSDKPVGVDIEGFRRYRESLMRYTMNDAEQRQILQAQRPDVEFTRLWTMKEAVVKRSGEGIAGRSMQHALEGLPFEIHTVINEEKHYIYSITT